MDFSHYDIGPFFDEMFVAPDQVRSGTDLLRRKIESLPPGELNRRQAAAEKALYDTGITFNVYGHDEATEKIWPFDLVPRIVPIDEWQHIEEGLKQRIQALNLFIDDIYHDQKVVKDGVVPEELIATAEGFLKPCVGLDPPQGVWCHISGSDLVRDGDGRLFVLEDNLRCPSGVSYVIANRRLMKRTFPEVFAASSVRAVESYPARLLDMLHAIAPSK
nr:circularly permuted type 2 ATP-grasp protein [Desulfobacterales bacterium]